MDNQDNQAEELRQRAIAMVPEDETQSPDEMRKILYELRVHQIELEMQNEELRRTQLELNAVKVRYFDLYDLAPLSYFTLNGQGLILQANFTAATLLCVLRGLLVGQSMSRFILNEDQDVFYLHLKQLLKSGTPQTCELRMVKNDGAQFWAYIQTTFTKNAKGIQELRLMLSDVTQRKQAEAALLESERLFRSLLQDANDAILLADIYGNLEQINPAGEMLLGYSRNEICQMNVNQIHPAAELAKVRQHFENIASKGGDLPHETKVLRKDGQVVDVEIRPSLIEINGRKLVQGIFIDLTKRNRQENERLEREIKLRSILVREVHHRIKNNLQGITGILRSYAQQYPEIAVPINQAISKMQSIAIIHGLQGRAVSLSVRACELTIAIAAGIGSLWQKPITIDIPDDWNPCLITEMEAVPLALVLNELISNAVKHGQTDEPVRIVLSHQPNPTSIKLTIHNNGLIPEGFGLEDTSCLGTGLQLVASLLPRAGARLTWAQHEDTVVTTLDLDEPIIQLEACT